eukprot:scaffold447_cov307-Pinguiococcus_pyrenoidosus.AAC.36
MVGAGRMASEDAAQNPRAVPVAPVSRRASVCQQSYVGPWKHEILSFWAAGKKKEAASQGLELGSFAEQPSDESFER